VVYSNGFKREKNYINFLEISFLKREKPLFLQPLLGVIYTGREAGTEDES
jgi:hypothetical protein